MSFPERATHRRNNNAPLRSGLPRVQEGRISPMTIMPTTSAPNPGSNSGRRRKSRSPGSSRIRTDAGTITTSIGKKRKSSASSSSTATTFAHAPDDMVVDRGRKPKLKPKTQSRYSVENSSSALEASMPSALVTSHRLSKKDRSKSRDSKERSRKHPLSEASITIDKGINLQPDAVGSFANAELLRVKKELEAHKKQAYENRKTINKQSKVIDELRQKVSASEKTIKDNETNIQKMKSKSKKSEEVLANIEGHISCQICMEMLLKPFALAPCGHVLCQGCLQEWFRKAPQNENEMMDDDDPDYLMYRLKSCPCCRANVRERPVPVFIVKSIAATFMKGKAIASSTVAARASPPPESDPWAGLFPPTGDDDFGEDVDNENEDDEDEDEDEDEDDYNEWLSSVFAYGSGSEDEAYEGDYVTPQWEPPHIYIDSDDYEFEDLDDEDLNILRRGATIDMLDTYHMTYTHAEGLVANVDDEHHLYLGWNVRLSADDDNGEEYIEYLFQDMLDRPERWDITEGTDGIRVCHRLVQEDDVVDYEDSDSDIWIGDDDIDST